MPDQLTIALDRLKQCASEEPPFLEAVIEAVVLLDLFRGALGFDQDSAKHSSRINTDMIDILLTSEKQNQVVIEVKRPDKLNGKDDAVNAMKQATRYLLQLKPLQHRGIVTDGNRWIFFMVETPPVRKKYLLRKLLDFDVASQPMLAYRVLKRCKKGSLLHFFAVLEAVHGDNDQTLLKAMKKMSFQERMQTLQSKASEASMVMTPADIGVFQKLYAKNAATVFITLNESPIEYRPFL